MLNGFETSCCILTMLDICSSVIKRNLTMLSFSYHTYVLVRLHFRWFLSYITFQSDVKLTQLCEFKLTQLSLHQLNVYTLLKGR